MPALKCACWAAGFSENILSLEILIMMSKKRLERKMCMIQPDRVRSEAKKKEDENFKFRS